MTTAEHTIDLEALLAPIPGEAPAGTELRYAPIYDKIRLARRVALDRQQGKTGVGEADVRESPEERAAAARDYWVQVGTLVADTLATQSKDLQLAVWLVEVE